MATTNAWNSNIPVEIAKGGTNATSFATTDGVVYFDGTSLVTTAAGTATDVLTSNGAGMAPTFQPAAGGGPGTKIFLASLYTTVSNATGNTVQYNVVFDTAIYDPGSNFNTGTGVFTAPATGNYQLNFLVTMGNLPGGITRAIVQLITTSASYKPFDVVPITGGGGELIYGWSTVTSMSSGDTAYIQVWVFGGTQTINVAGSGGGALLPTIFNGYFVSS